MIGDYLLIPPAPTLPLVGVFDLRAGDLLLQLVLEEGGGAKASPIRQADRDLDGDFYPHGNRRIVRPVETSCRGIVWFQGLASYGRAQVNGRIHSYLLGNRNHIKVK